MMAYGCACQNSHTYSIGSQATSILTPRLEYDERISQHHSAQKQKIKISILLNTCMNRAIRVSMLSNLAAFIGTCCSKALGILRRLLRHIRQRCPWRTVQVIPPQEKWKPEGH